MGDIAKYASLLNNDQDASSEKKDGYRSQFNSAKNSRDVWAEARHVLLKGDPQEAKKMAHQIRHNKTPTVSGTWPNSSSSTSTQTSTSSRPSSENDQKTNKKKS